MTAPFDPAVTELIRGSHRQQVSALAVNVATLDVLDYSITWDEDASPRVMLRLECAIPDASDLELLDPRTGVRLWFYARYLLPDGTWDNHRLVDLGLRSRRVSRPADTMTLICASDEALYIDAAPSIHFFDGQVSYPSPADAVRQQLAAMAAGSPLSGTVVVTTPAPDPADPPFMADEFPTDRWAVCMDAADALDADLYDNGDRVMRLAPRSHATGPATLTLATGPTSTITESDAFLDREAWNNGVLILWEWENDGSTANKRWGQQYVNAGPYRPEVAGTRLHTETRQGYMTSARAGHIAAAVLRRRLARARSYTITSVAAWWVRPGHTVTVQLPTGDQERHIVSRVTFTTGGRMQLVTRLPDNESTIGE